MPPNDGNTLGSANVRITADVTDLNAKVDQAKAKVEEVGKTAAQAWDEIASPGAKRLSENVAAANERIEQQKLVLKQVGDAAGEATEKGKKLQTVIRSITGGAAALGGAIVTIKAAVEAIGDYIEARFGNGGGAAGALLDKLNDAKPEQRLKAVSEELKQINKELEYKTDHPILGSFLGQGEKKLLDKQAELIKTEEALRSESKRRQISKDAEEDKRAAEKRAETERDISEQIVEARIALLPDETNRAVSEISNKKRLLWEDEKKDGISRKQLIDELTKMQLKLLADRDQKQAIDSEKEQLKVTKERLKTEEKINQTRLQGILQAQEALDRLYATQAAGFNGEGSNNSLQGSIDALEIAVRGAAARMGGI